MNELVFKSAGFKSAGFFPFLPLTFPFLVRSGLVEGGDFLQRDMLMGTHTLLYTNAASTPLGLFRFLPHPNLLDKV